MAQVWTDFMLALWNINKKFGGNKNAPVAGA
jgi:hypothetical protein